MSNPDFTKDARVIVPSELSADELWQRNGEYVPIEFVRQAEQVAREQALEEAALISTEFRVWRERNEEGGDYVGRLRVEIAEAIRALKDQK